MLRDTLGVIDKNAVDTSDATYQAWVNDQSISLKDYLNYAASQNWINISVISPKGEYLDSQEIYQALTDYVIDYLKTDTGFSKLLYKYLLMNDQISGSRSVWCCMNRAFCQKKTTAMKIWHLVRCHHMIL